MFMIKRLLIVLLSFVGLSACAQSETSVAGLFGIKDCGRLVWNFNPEWRFHLGDVQGAEKVDFDDSEWDVVSTPHCVKLEPAEASGCRNYQGVAWYRKHFIVPTSAKDKDVEIFFEAIMGKQKIFVNGKLASEHFGGYLPVVIHLDKMGLKAGDKCVIAVMTDNSNDKTYPPGKPEYTLDFAYHGGIYRDVWLIAKSKLAITDAVEAGKVAGGGVFLHYSDISEHSAEVFVNTDVRNNGVQTASFSVENIITDATGKMLKRMKSASVTLKAGESTTVITHSKIQNPKLWSPESPYLYNMYTRVKQGNGTSDGGMTRFGIRSFEFKGKDGFWLNGHKYRQFVGANRHQDFAYVGNAVPNSQQWRDVKRLKNAGFNIIRTAHYPQDPAFMDACDELGMFIIVATPGWQYWNKDSLFGARVQENTREIIRRDRNHPCVLMWEPILNETRFPEDFALKALQITKDEYPYPYRPVAAADMNSAGVRANYDVVYGWPGDDEKSDKPSQCIFTREFGEYVDDWYAHNNINRASRSWGERPQLMQALSLAATTKDMYRTTGQFIGGCQWHPFDHQRGYHPDPYWGGIYDAFRQPKYAYYMFHSQIPAKRDSAFVYIAHEMTQFSEPDVVVFSNCDSVRLTIFDGAKSWTLPVEHVKDADYSAPVTFKDAWDFWAARELSYKQKSWQKVRMTAEGIIDGKVVCTTKKMPSRRSTKLRLYVDDMGRPMVADGSDFMVVVAEVTDDNGNVRRLAKENVVFSVQGEGEIIGDASINANPRTVEWGSAPVLIRSTRKAGKILIKAQVQFPGTNAPSSDSIEITTVPADMPFCFTPQTHTEKTIKQNETDKGTQELTEEQKHKMLKEVEQQQADFGSEK
jgi:beta-galactosidase